MSMLALGQTCWLVLGAILMNATKNQLAACTCSTCALVTGPTEPHALKTSAAYSLFQGCRSIQYYIGVKQGEGCKPVKQSLLFDAVSAVHPAICLNQICQVRGVLERK